MIKLLLISNMYPSSENPSYGVFVKNFETQINSSSDIAISQKVVINEQGGGVVKKLKRYLQFYFQIITALVGNKFDIVYVHFPVYTAFILLVWPLRQKNLVLNFHGSDVIGAGIKFRFLAFLTKCVVKKAALVVAPSAFLADELKNRMAVTEEKLYVSPSGGVDSKHFYPINKRDARKKVKLFEQFTIGFISRFDVGKGWDVFLEAVSILKNTHSLLVQALVVGDGGQKDDFFAKVKTLEIEDQIKYFGRKQQSDLALYFSSLDVFVASSLLEESLGLVGLEAMACGVPVAGSDKAGIATYVVDRVNGYLFKPGCAHELADSIMEYYSLNDASRKILCKQASETAKKYESNYVNQLLCEKLITL